MSVLAIPLMAVLFLDLRSHYDLLADFEATLLHFSSSLLAPISNCREEAKLRGCQMDTPLDSPSLRENTWSCLRTVSVSIYYLLTLNFNSS